MHVRQRLGKCRSLLQIIRFDLTHDWLPTRLSALSNTGHESRGQPGYVQSLGTRHTVRH
jgi:hypothetical protein